MTKHPAPAGDGGESSAQARRTYYLDRLLSANDAYLLPSLSRKRAGAPGQAYGTCRTCSGLPPDSDGAPPRAQRPGCKCPAAPEVEYSPKHRTDVRWNRGL